MRSGAVIAAIAVSCGSVSPAVAQFSTELPGIPRAGVPSLGHAQGRTTLDVSGFQLDREGSRERIGRVTLDWGRTYRLFENVEFGFDLTLASGALHHFEQDAGPESTTFMEGRALVLYGLTFGLKVRPLAYVGSDGRGLEAAIALAYAPALRPLLVYEQYQDTSYLGGYVGKDRDAAFIDELPSTTAVGPIVSYRSSRITLDLAVMAEGTSDENAAPIRSFSGVYPRAGLKLRLSRSLAVGASYWGDGTPLWRSRTTESEFERHERVAFYIGFGAGIEAGTDLIVGTPTGSFSESASLVLRSRRSW